MILRIERNISFDVSLDLVAENANDWTHFLHMHRRSHLDYILIHQEGRKSVFYYRARILYPFAASQPYLVFREELPDEKGYHQRYLNLNNKKWSYLKSVCQQDGDRAWIRAEFTFEVSSLWKWFPSAFRWVFLFRMKRVFEEDNEYLAERSIKKIETKICAPRVEPLTQSVRLEPLTGPGETIGLDKIEHFINLVKRS